MSALKHVLGLETVGTYRAPSDGNPKPAEIPPGCELIEFMVGGEATFEWEGKSTEVRPGHMLWHRAGDFTVYQNNVDSPYECVTIRFRVEVGAPRPAPHVSFWRDVREARAFADELLGIFHRGNFDKESFCSYTYSRFLWQARLSEMRQPDESWPSALRTCLELVEEAWSDTLKLSRLEEVTGLSASHIHLLFRRHLETSPHRHILKKRMAEACRLLVTTDLPAKQIAGKCGFSNAASFGRSFRSSMHVTPDAYRRRYAVPL